jgi:hypothetical protein
MPAASCRLAGSDGSRPQPLPQKSCGRLGEAIRPLPHPIRFGAPSVVPQLRAGMPLAECARMRWEGCLSPPQPARAIFVEQYPRIYLIELWETA